MLERFKQNPDEYGEVSFYWWVGEKLTKERLLWQLDKLKEHHIRALQINYCHSDEDEYTSRHTIDSEPKLFTDEWWELVHWFVDECKKYNISVALSDYTLGLPGQGQYLDRVMSKYPEYAGKMLKYENGKVTVETVKNSLDPMNKNLGDAVIDEFYGEFDNHFPDEMGKGINYFFSDELSFNIRGNLWNDNFAEEFEKRKGYDIIPYLKAIFEDIGDITPKIRLDYYDVIVQLSEEGYFKKIYEWSQSRGITFGCDHGGRGRDVTEFGDYFRTQRWLQAPGNDQPNLLSDIIKNKVASSISHMYNRPRTWLEGFYGSGWGTSSTEIADAVFRNFAMGHNLLTLHGLYYTTYGGYWEWAPPCNHFRMPYWEHMNKFLECTKRLSHLLSSGTHVCDVGILYPVAAVESGMDGKKAVDTAFKTAEYLYKNTIDFDFIDFESLNRAEIQNSKLCINDERYSVIIIPAMKAIRYSNIETLKKFSDNGGTVIFIGCVPAASDRAGRNDDMLNGIVTEMVSRTPVVSDEKEAESIIRNTVVSDIICNDKPYFMHRIIDGIDAYMIYGGRKDTEYFFRAKGKACLFNPWTGEETDLEIENQTKDGTVIKLPLSETEVGIIAFDKTAEPIYSKKECESTVKVLDDTWGFELLPTLDNKYGDFSLPAYDEKIGAQSRYFKFTQGEREKEIQCTFGTYFFKLGALPKEIDEELLSLDTITDKTSVTIDGKTYKFTPYDFSMRYGLPHDAGRQHSYHGLKGIISNEFIALGKKRVTFYNSSSVYEKEDDGDIYYMYTSVVCDDETNVYIKTGTLKYDKLYINGSEITGDTAVLKSGVNTVLIRYNGAGRTYFILDRLKETKKQDYPLAMDWYNNETVIEFNPYLQDDDCHFVFMSPPALEHVSFKAQNLKGVYIDGERVKHTKTGENKYIVSTDTKNTSPRKIEIVTGGAKREASITDYIDFKCGKGEIKTGDWAVYEGLKTYSGGAKYTKTVTLDAAKKTVIDLGEVGCSAEVIVNKKSAGVKFAPPYLFDITECVKNGNNEIEVIVYNTLYNHYLTIPTYYNKKKQKSGIMGDVKIVQYL